VGGQAEVGGTVAGFRLDGLVGSGGMGRVHRATDLTLKRRVAVKVVAPDLAEDVQFRERFLLEAELAARLDHPAIVPIY
jgi:serine/threonine-protein kinase